MPTSEELPDVTCKLCMKAWFTRSEHVPILTLPKDANPEFRSVDEQGSTPSTEPIECICTEWTEFDPCDETAEFESGLISTGQWLDIEFCCVSEFKNALAGEECKEWVRWCCACFGVAGCEWQFCADCKKPHGSNGKMPGKNVCQNDSITQKIKYYKIFIHPKREYKKNLQQKL